MYWGTLGGIVGGLGLVFLSSAIVRGPGGPIYAITSMSSPCLVIIEALVDWKMVSVLELFGCLFGLFGAFIITNPDFFMKNCFFCLSSSTRGEEVRDVSVKNVEETEEILK